MFLPWPMQLPSPKDTQLFLLLRWHVRHICGVGRLLGIDGRSIPDYFWPHSLTSWTLPSSLPPLSSFLRVSCFFLTFSSRWLKSNSLFQNDAGSFLTNVIFIVLKSNYCIWMKVPFYNLQLVSLVKFNPWRWGCWVEIRRT